MNDKLCYQLISFIYGGVGLASIIFGLFYQGLLSPSMFDILLCIFLLSIPIVIFSFVKIEGINVEIDARKIEEMDKDSLDDWILSNSMRYVKKVFKISGRAIGGTILKEVDKNWRG